MENNEDVFVSLEVRFNFFEDNEDIFLNNENIRTKAVYRKSKVMPNDNVYKEKLNALIEARNDLLDYEISMKYKSIIK